MTEYDYEREDIDYGVAWNDNEYPDYGDEGGMECMEPGNYEECMFQHPEKYCGCWKECKRGDL
jgi:hypothetical protein